MRTLRLGTRPSRLAVKQAEEIRRLLPEIDFEIVVISTAGDEDKTTPLTETEGTDFFTGELETAILEGRIDAAVHSAKDLEENPPAGLTTAAVTVSVSGHDCLVSRNGLPLSALPRGAIVGTSSKNRKEAILRYRSDLAIKNIRGDIDERLAQLDGGKFDAIVVAHAALIRLGYEDRVAEIVPDTIARPHPLQGRLAVQVLKTREDLVRIFEGIDEKAKR